PIEQGSDHHRADLCHFEHAGHGCGSHPPPNYRAAAQRSARSARPARQFHLHAPCSLRSFFMSTSALDWHLSDNNSQQPPYQRDAPADKSKGYAQPEQVSIGPLGIPEETVHREAPAEAVRVRLSVCVEMRDAEQPQSHLRRRSSYRREMDLFSKRRHGVNKTVKLRRKTVKLR